MSPSTTNYNLIYTQYANPGNLAVIVMYICSVRHVVHSTQCQMHNGAENEIKVDIGRDTGASGLSRMD